MGEVVPSSYLADPTCPIPSHCASIVATSTVRVNCVIWESEKKSLQNQKQSAEKLNPQVDSLLFAAVLLLL